MRYAIAIAVLFHITQAWAAEVTVSGAWARATAPGQDSAVVYLTVASGQEASIVAVSSPVAESAGIHNMSHDNGMMKMRELDALPLPAGQKVTLGPGGTHLMLSGLKRQLKAGEAVPLTLTVQFSGKRREKVEVKAEVRALAAEQGMHDHQH